MANIRNMSSGDRDKAHQAMGMSGKAKPRSYAAGGQVEAPIAFRGGRNYRAPQFTSPFGGAPADAGSSGGGGGGAATTGPAAEDRVNPYFDTRGLGVGERANNVTPGPAADQSWRGVGSAVMNMGKFAMSPMGFAADVLLDTALGNNSARPQGRLNAIRAGVESLISPQGQRGGGDGTFDAKTGMAPGERSLGIDRSVTSAPLDGPPAPSSPPTSLVDPVDTQSGDRTAPPGPAPAPPGEVVTPDFSREAERGGMPGPPEPIGGGDVATAGSDLGSDTGGLYGDGGSIAGAPGQPIPITAHAKEYVLPVAFMEALAMQLVGTPDVDAAAAILDEIVAEVTGSPTNSGPRGMSADGGGEESGLDEGDDEQFYGVNEQAAPAPGMVAPRPAGGRLAQIRSGQQT